MSARAEAYPGGWAAAMAVAYSLGLADGKAGRPSREASQDFRGCYLQGYQHGRAARHT